MVDSCFVERLQHYLPLTAAEKESLAALELSPEPLGSGAVLFEEEESCDMVALVRTGWLTSSELLADGQRQIVRVHLAGDMAGLSNLAFPRGVFRVVAHAPSEVCRLPRRALATLFDEHPRLAALFFAMGMAEMVELADRMKAIGRTSGKARLAQFFLSVLSRHRIVGDALGVTMTMPLTQTELADAVGLTNIHVNRLLRELVQEGLIRRERGSVTVLREAEMGALAQFTDRFRALDTSWFPAAA